MFSNNNKRASNLSMTKNLMIKLEHLAQFTDCLTNRG